MKAITCDVILTGVSTRADGSLSLRFSTPELSTMEKVAVMELQNKELKILLQPTDSNEAMVTIKKGVTTPSQRLRAALHVAWSKSGRAGDFDTFYVRRMEVIINSI